MTHLALSTGTPAFLAGPADGSTPTTGLVLWPDIFGLRPVFEGHAQRLADDHRWAVCVIEMYPGQETLAVQDRHGAAAAFQDDDKLADLEAAIGLCGTAETHVMGFCMGGMYAMKSLASSSITRSVAFYGMVHVPTGWAGEGQRDAVDFIRPRPEDLLAVFGGDDPWCPEADQDELEALGAQVVRYPGAGHGWAQDPDREGYRAADAADAWTRAEAFLSGDR